MTCHLGYAPQHMAFVLCYLALVSWLLAVAHRGALYLRVLVSAGAVAAVLYHLLAGAACVSPSTIHAYLHTAPPLRLRLMFLCTSILSHACMASHCIGQGSGRIKMKMANLVAVTVPLMAGACILWGEWGMEDGADNLFTKFLPVFGLSHTASGVSIYAATGSKAMLRVGYLIGALLLSSALVRECNQLDFEGRVVPRSSEDAIHPHWSAAFHFVLADTPLLLAQVAAGHAVIDHSRSQPSLSTPFAAYISLPKILAASAWNVLPQHMKRP